MLTEADAIGIAEKAVRERYSVAPPVALAMLFSDELIEQGRGLMPESEYQLGKDKYSGKWLVFFRCSWDTDELGLPISLMVTEDGNSGEAEVVPGERSDWQPPWAP